MEKKIISAVEKVFSVKESCFHEKQKTSNEIEARSVLMYLLREYCGTTYSQLAKRFDTTQRNCMYHVANIKKKLETNISTSIVINEIKKEIEK